MAVAGVPSGKPLRLKDFLELDCESCSAAGFRCYPRRLCVAAPSPARRCNLRLEAAEAPRFGRSPSLRPKLSHISRSISRRLRDGFSSWRRHEEETAAPVSEPCAPPDAVASSSSSDSETSESGSSSPGGKSESDFSSASSESLPHPSAAQATADAGAGAVHETMERSYEEAAGRSGSEGDEKEQLSPVAVMDFPSDDDVVEEKGRDGGAGACSPSFSDSLAQLQRRKTQLQHEIRRLGSIVELGAVDLEARFAASDSDDLATVATTASSCHGSADHDDQTFFHGLLTATAVGVSERLLLDFFAETAVPNLNSSENAEAVVRLAKGWLEGTGDQWGLKDVLCRREVFLAGMERSRRWPARVGEEEERKVGVVVAAMVVDELLGELLMDLVVYAEL